MAAAVIGLSDLFHFALGSLVASSPNLGVITPLFVLYQVLEYEQTRDRVWLDLFLYFLGFSFFYSTVV